MGTPYITLTDYCDERDITVLTLDGFEDCVVGITLYAGWEGYVEERSVYDAGMIIEKLESQGLSYEDAIEYFEFNVIGAYLGPKTPIFINRVRPDKPAEASSPCETPDK